ncbi:MAG TPA: substrate-binding domain-containing protein, partial [Streptosporangiaceae bacterium]|nr:substrate-binding domain-containing protein [Streptosporangiaceae bacterium]
EVSEDLIVYASRYTVEEGSRCCGDLLARHGGFTAVAAANDMLAVGCYTAIDEAGLQCPDDISVIGFNDMPFIDRLRPPLTTVRFPHYQLGTEAAQLLLERIGEREAPVKIMYLAPELVVRGSTAEPAGPAWQAAETEPEEEEESEAGHAVPVALHRAASRRAGGAFQS